MSTFAAILLPQVNRAQTPSTQSTFKLGVDVVQVDVSVLDDKRRAVRGLTAADFTVFEDGKPRPVTVCNPIEIEEHPPSVNGTASWVRDVPPDVTTNDVKPEGRLVVIMLDWSIRPEEQVSARKIAAAAVDELGPGIWPPWSSPVCFRTPGRRRISRPAGPGSWRPSTNRSRSHSSNRAASWRILAITIVR